MEALRLYRGTRQIVHYEEVEVFARHYDEARELIEADDASVKVIAENDGDLELYGQLIEIKE